MEMLKKVKKPLPVTRDHRKASVDLGATQLVKEWFLGNGPGLPVVVEPSLPDVDLIEWVRANPSRVNDLLDTYGGILFRGFGVAGVRDFQEVCQAICPQLFGEYGDLPTERHSDKIYGATPYPADKVILFHNESSHTHRWPLRQFFHSVVVAAEGGETPLVDGRRVLERLEPAVRATFEQKGLLYVRNFSKGFDVSWQQFFRTLDKREVEVACEERGIEYEWFNDELRTRQWAPAVVEHPRTGEKVFFNQIQLHHISCLDAEVQASVKALFPEERWPRNVYYGDGSAIPDAVVQELLGVYWGLAVQAPWKNGDVVALDNMIVSHGRNAYRGSRKVVVAMGEMIEAETLRQQGKAHWIRPA
jgi:alpha-ketoglutarate-dependent taurine dioxygenase